MTVVLSEVMSILLWAVSSPSCWKVVVFMRALPGLVIWLSLTDSSLVSCMAGSSMNGTLFTQGKRLGGLYKILT